MTLPTLFAALLLTVVPPPRPPGEPPPPAPQTRVVLTVSDAGGPRPGVLMQLFRVGVGGRPLPLPGRPALARSGADGIASLTLPVTAPLLVQLTDPERNVLVRLPLGGGEVVRVGAATFRLQVTPASPGR
ncbi:hypothetical protein DAETH_26510 [Deinococcus aetherius]|uniref:Uncharacterized protein n=1 Tax=Deinococcus aetherius TaxID=200252 RepID=A0ABN6RM52_9DEIO|nr:hypothetical protein [Deinococcus aetherius]BDP42682.1 hypothetical protein DAETH_26510 [Deinococcus aetherius]